MLPLESEVVFNSLLSANALARDEVFLHMRLEL
jgi:hypothetical protein